MSVVADRVNLYLYWMIILCGVYVLLLRNLEFLLECFKVNGYKILFSSGGTLMFFTCLSTNIIKMVERGVVILWLLGNLGEGYKFAINGIRNLCITIFKS